MLCIPISCNEDVLPFQLKKLPAWLFSNNSSWDDGRRPRLKNCGQSARPRDNAISCFFSPHFQLLSTSKPRLQELWVTCCTKRQVSGNHLQRPIQSPRETSRRNWTSPVNLHSSLTSNSTAGRRAHAVGPDASSAFCLELPRFLSGMGRSPATERVPAPRACLAAESPGRGCTLNGPGAGGGMGPQGTSQLSCPWTASQP